MINLKTTLFILAGFLIATTTAQDQLITTGIMNTMFAQPLTADAFLSSPLLIAPLISSSACGPNEVQDANHVCIKPEYIEGCQTYETVSTCSKCALGYSLNKDKKCVYITTFTGTVTHIKGCIRQTDSVCDTCAQGFYSKDNKCALGVRNCVAYNKDGECTECEHHFSLILSQCRKNGLLGCKYEAESHTCSECYPPFTLNGQHCEIDQCRILNDYGCVACECGYYLSIDRQCKPISQGCLRYEKGICKNCLPHYKLKGGVCEIEGCVEYSGSYCKRCSEKYDLVDGECKFKNCLDWLNDQCITCAKGFGLKNGLCVTATTVTCA